MESKNNKQDQERMKQLIELLNKASRAYYAEDREVMSNYEYDKLYDELEKLETKTGVILTGSPTVKVGYESVEELPKERHEQPMLSLGKTKDREELRQWLQGNPALLSWKLDGLTIVLTYREGKLAKAVTRGNGEIGEVITANARTFQNIPLQIPYQGELILRGEAVITYSDFEKINEQIGDADAKYKNPRNLCSGSVRQLNSEITARRKVRFYAFALVKAEGVEFDNKRSGEFVFLKSQGFDVVDYTVVTEENILDAVHQFEEKIVDYDVPSDGLVLTYEDIDYGKSLGMTAKFPRNSIAFKWQDEIRETKLVEIEWSPSRTGLINPVAIFEPVELEGTTVSRASVHNISILRALKLGIGDTITVYKANMIIPQIAENLTGSDNLKIPDTCPACGGKTKITQQGDTATLICENTECAAKKIKHYSHMVSRNALNIDGLSEATLEKFIGKGFIHEAADLFRLERYKDVIVKMDGFGVKSYDNLIGSINTARHTTLARLIYALGIAGIGAANAKMLCRYFQDDLSKLKEASVEELGLVDGVGDVLAGAIAAYFADENKQKELESLLKELEIEHTETDSSDDSLAGLVFVVTGSLNHFDNRNALKEVIERKGGKVTGSVTSKTTCLINNDNTSNSTKNKTAKSNGIPILTEEEFMNRYLEWNKEADMKQPN